MKKIYISCISIVVVLGLGVFLIAKKNKSTGISAPATIWSVQSIDTMKYSRDLAREKLSSKEFDVVINNQVKQISETGATHVVIATPYDAEFLPFLNRWVTAARKYQLHVWFRGNWSGWEEWFGYPKISPEQHIAQTVQFILSNKNLFQDGDIFSACPECENGAMGDPRQTGKVQEYRTFLTRLTTECQNAASEINKKIICNYHSMNADVAKLIMDKETVAKNGGIIVIDHYTKTGEQLSEDAKEFAASTNAKIVIGEFGSPVPDIHGNQSEKDQAEWLQSTFESISQQSNIIGVNYWTSVGGSTSLWDSKGARPAVAVLTKFYSPRNINLQIKSTSGKVVSTATVAYNGHAYAPDKNGDVSVPVINDKPITISAEGFVSHGLVNEIPQNEKVVIYIDKIDKNIFYKIQELLFNLSHSIIHS